MAAINPTLFDWDAIESRSDLDRFLLVRDHLPDARLVQYLDVMRGHGRNDYPVRALWNALIAGIVFQHPSISALIRELDRNPALLQACGFNPLPIQHKPGIQVVSADGGQRPVARSDAPEAAYRPVPSQASFSRFLANLIELEEALGLVSELMTCLRESLMDALPDFGRHLGYDGKAIASHSTGRRQRATGKTSDPTADWGVHETTSTDPHGKTRRQRKRWFGYTLHLIADTRYEIPVTFDLTPASHSEHNALRAQLPELFTQTPALATRCDDFSADRGLDSAQTKALLWDTWRIRPLIDTRHLWREEKQHPDYDPDQSITRPLFPERVDTILYTEQGSLHCRCPLTGEQRDMAFQGFEADRGCLKYRCPAAAYGLTCKGQALCHQQGGVQPGPYGRIVRIKLKAHDRRIFVPTPHGSPHWRRGYNRRSALERINSRIDRDFGFERHFIRGLTKMKTRAGLAMAVMMAIALGHARQGRQAQVRSLVGAIPPPG